MRAATRISLTLGGVGFLVFGVYSIYLLAEERRELYTTHAESVFMLTRGLQVSVENALRDDQARDVDELLHALRALDEGTEVLVIDRAGRTIAASGEEAEARALLGGLARETLRAGSSDPRLLPEDEPRTLAVGLAVRDAAGALRGSLVLARSLAELERDLARTRRGSVLSLILFALATALLGHVLGRVYIGRPLERLGAEMGRVRVGDFGAGLELERRDEFSILAGHFNAMVAELRETRRRLEEETRSRRRLEQGLQEADKLITIGHLSARLAHEIGSPLQVLGGRARALFSRAEDPAAVRRNAAILIEQNERIALIVEQLLRYARRAPARIEARGPGGRPTPIDPLPPLRSVVDLLDLEATRRGVALLLVEDSALPPIEISPGQLQQILLNLLTNALAATPSGGSVEVRLAPAALADGRDALRLEVLDTGRGVSPQDQGRLFEPFFTTRAEEGGTGLGLTVVKALIDEHEGQIAIEPRAQGGTRALVELPLCRTELSARRGQGEWELAR